ncbi:MAG: FAD-dependent oxidoreductase [Alphaproteobacteria bacterium]|nr:FAD-dependent oxidoreductase [Alphaproteobacteria bacterium]
MTDLTIIIGGGLAGVTSFYELTARGLPCLLIDAEADVARGASFANGGGLHPSLPDPWNNPGIGRHLLASLFQRDAAMKLHLAQIPRLAGWGMAFLRHSARKNYDAIARANFDLAEYSTRQTEALQQFLNLDYDSAAPGTLKLMRTQAERDEALRLADMLAAKGLRYEALNRADLLACEPSLAAAQGLVGALRFPDDGIGDARRFCQGLAAVALKNGGEMRLNTKVENLLIEGGAVVGVRLRDTELRGRVVVAAGVAASDLARPLGMRLPIRPAKGYSLTLDAGHLSKERPRHLLVDPMQHIAITPLGDRLRILGMAEFVGNDKRIQQRRLTQLRGFFETLLPDTAQKLDWARAQGWAGLRPMSADGRPFIGASNVDGLWLNCGHGHLGWTMAVGSARLLADQMTGRTPEIDAAPFSPNSTIRRLR